MPVLSSLLEVAGLILVVVGLYHLGGGWLVALVVGVVLTVTGLALGRPVDEKDGRREVRRA